MLKALKSLLKRQETADGVAGQITEIEGLNEQLSIRITDLEQHVGELLAGGVAEASIGKLETELEAAQRERTRVEMVLKTLRAKHTQLARSELEVRIEKQLRAATKAVEALPAAITRYTNAAGPVIDALRIMRRMTDVAVALCHGNSYQGAPEALGTVSALWKAARIPSTEVLGDPARAMLLWPAEDPDAPRTVVTVGAGRRKVGDWPLDLAEAGKRATDALVAYERGAPRLRAVVAELTKFDDVIVNARRDTITAELVVPDSIEQYRALIRFLDGIKIPDVPDDAPRLELPSLGTRRRGTLHAGIEV